MRKGARGPTAYWLKGEQMVKPVIDIPILQPGPRKNVRLIRDLSVKEAELPRLEREWLVKGIDHLQNKVRRVCTSFIVALELSETLQNAKLSPVLSADERVAAGLKALGRPKVDQWKIDTKLIRAHKHGFAVGGITVVSTREEAKDLVRKLKLYQP